MAMRDETHPFVPFTLREEFRHWKLLHALGISFDLAGEEATERFA